MFETLHFNEPLSTYSVLISHSLYLDYRLTDDAPHTTHCF